MQIKAERELCPLRHYRQLKQEKTACSFTYKWVRRKSVALAPPTLSGAAAWWEMHHYLLFVTIAGNFTTDTQLIVLQMHGFHQWAIDSNHRPCNMRTIFPQQSVCQSVLGQVLNLKLLSMAVCVSVPDEQVGTLCRHAVNSFAIIFPHWVTSSDLI